MNLPTTDVQSTDDLLRRALGIQSSGSVFNEKSGVPEVFFNALHDVFPQDNVEQFLSNRIKIRADLLLPASADQWTTVAP